MIGAASRVAQSIAGDLIVYVCCPLLVALVIGLVTILRHFDKRLETQDKALSILVQEVMPANQPSLRTIVGDLRTDVAELEGRVPRIRR